MKLTVLIDNNTLTDRYFYGEPAVSYFIEEEKIRLLFDVGYSDAFIKNAQKMNIDLSDLNFVVLSHGHLDHTWGLGPLIQLFTEWGIEDIKYLRPTVIAHPFAFLPRRINTVGQIGPLVSEKEAARHFRLRLSKEPVWLTDRLVFLGEIERKNDFEAKNPIGKIIESDGEKDDYVMDDSALAYQTTDGLVIITGCSHAGICNIIESAKEICGDDRVRDVIGGFHLLKPSRAQLQGTLEFLKKLSPVEIHPCHCTDLSSKIALSKVVDLKEVGVGLKLEYE
ncbi:MAG: MBL fold metallo-hydrolase [Deltaproteobacteria bacterium]|nr:MAG: MBL fold metallo-hydrolase [Deltaproteobacteria bacterium]